MFLHFPLKLASDIVKCKQNHVDILSYCKVVFWQCLLSYGRSRLRARGSLTRIRQPLSPLNQQNLIRTVELPPHLVRNKTQFTLRPRNHRFALQAGDKPRISSVERKKIHVR